MGPCSLPCTRMGLEDRVAVWGMTEMEERVARASSVTACCPGHLSGYFRPVSGSDYRTTGSIGAGIVIEEGVVVRATPSTVPGIVARRIGEDGTVLEELHESPPLAYVVRRLHAGVQLESVCSLPIGAGFGLSAAALMAAVAAINELFGLGMTPGACAELAHEAEIVHRTGLGDVAACQGGGRDYRLGPGIAAEIHRFSDLDAPIFAVTFGPLPSPLVLGSASALERIGAAYPEEYPGTPAGFFRLSRLFAEKSGLLTGELNDLLRVCEEHRVMASMTMLGNGVFAMGEGAEDLLSSYGTVLELHAAREGVRITEVRP